MANTPQVPGLPEPAFIHQAGMYSAQQGQLGMQTNNQCYGGGEGGSGCRAESWGQGLGEGGPGDGGR